MGGQHQRRQKLKALKEWLDNEAPISYRVVKTDENLLGHTDQKINEYINSVGYAIEENEDKPDMVVDPTNDDNDLVPHEVLE